MKKKKTFEFDSFASLSRPRIEKEGLTERAIILCKLNKSLLESSLSVGIRDLSRDDCIEEFIKRI